MSLIVGLFARFMHETFGGGANSVICGASRLVVAMDETPVLSDPEPLPWRWLWASMNENCSILSEAVWAPDPGHSCMLKV